MPVPNHPAGGSFPHKIARQLSHFSFSVRGHISGRPPASIARFGRRPTLPSETLRIPNRPRTAVTVRLSLSDIIVMVFPASTISRSCFSSSGCHGRLGYFLGGIILTEDANPVRAAAFGRLKSAVLSALAFVVLGLVGLSEPAAAARGVQTFERQGRS
jgi:hypothetical protein